jgi:GntR family transcriptional regulator, transcriptional repressor for pyruvate dehydrogenase complex
MPLVPDWAVDIHLRTLAAIRGGDFDEIDAVMDEHLAKLEQTWEHEVRRPAARALPPFLRR